jgi:hypothetical protein
VQRQPKVLSFEALKVRAATNIAGSSEKANVIVSLDKFGGKESGGCAASFHKKLGVEYSLQGSELPGMSRSVVENIANSFPKTSM